MATGGGEPGLGKGERFDEVELQVLGLAQDEDYFRIEFDHGATVNYGLCLSFLVSLSSCFFWPFWCLTCPCLYCALMGQAQSRKGAVTSKQIVYKSMVYSCFCCCENITTKTVPLSKITDLSIHQGCLQKCFDINQISVETASSPAPEIVLLGAKQAYKLRQMVLKMRDEGGAAGGLAGGVNNVAINSGATASLIANNAQLGQQTLVLDQNRNATLNEIRDVLIDVRAGLSNLGAIKNGGNNGPGTAYAPMYR